VLMSSTGAQLTHVPYKGGSTSIIGIMSGEVHSLFSSVPTVLGQIQSGRLRALGISTLKRSSVLPDVPTIAESGLPGYRAESWHGLLVPAKTPRPIVAKLHAEVVRVLQQPDAREQFAKLGLVSPPTTPEEFDKFIRGEISAYKQIARAGNIKTD